MIQIVSCVIRLLTICIFIITKGKNMKAVFREIIKNNYYISYKYENPLLIGFNLVIKINIKKFKV
jgi:hypothetical protein